MGRFKILTILRSRYGLEGVEEAFTHFGDGSSGSCGSCGLTNSGSECLSLTHSLTQVS